MKTVKDLPESEWEKIIHNSSHATFFHSPIWGNIIEESFPNRKKKAIGFNFGEDKKALIPYIAHARIGPINNIYSMEPGVYGGIISNFDINQSQVEKAVEKLESISHYRTNITGNPYLDYNLSWEGEEDFTQVVCLENDYEDIWENYDYSCQKQIKKAEEEGLSATVASNLEDYKKYYLIYQKNLVRWGKDPNSDHPYDLFATIYEYQEEYPENIRLWLVKDNDEIIGGTLVFYLNGKHSVEWHAVFDSDYFSKGVRNFLVDKIIEDACERGFKYYDFNPSGGHEGVVRFKSTFDPKRKKIKRWTKENQKLKSLRKMKSKTENLLRSNEVNNNE
jgi:lipid II:glycine glycyltransferase (peptidoglycan interpeptide bridge formation enzyme)